MTLDRKQGKAIVKGYVELFGYPKEFDTKLTKQQKILYEIDKKQ